MMRFQTIILVDMVILMVTIVQLKVTIKSIMYVTITEVMVMQHRLNK